MDVHFITLKQFCAVYACGKTKAYELIASGEIEAVRLGGALRVVAASAQRWAEQLPKKQSRQSPRKQENQNVEAD